MARPPLPRGGLVALDWGLKKVGVATVDETGSVVTPQPVFRRVNAGQTWSLNSGDKNFLQELVRRFEPGALVLGLPAHADGHETEAASHARRFKGKLGDFCKLPVHLVNEALTSWEAGENDSDAAALLLNDYLAMLERGET